MSGLAFAADDHDSSSHSGKGGSKGPAAAHGAKKGKGRHVSPSDSDSKHGGLEDKVFRGKDAGSHDDPDHEHDDDKHADGEEHDDKQHDSDTHADKDSHDSDKHADGDDHDHDDSDHDDKDHEGGKKGQMKGRPTGKSS